LDICLNEFAMEQIKLEIGYKKTSPVLPFTRSWYEVLVRFEVYVFTVITHVLKNMEKEIFNGLYEVSNIKLIVLQNLKK